MVALMGGHRRAKALLDSIFLEKFGRETDTTFNWGVREPAS